jgi:AcrR family transcriptional regulator
VPKQVDPEQRRLLVADAVLDEILENGIHSVTLARIAQRTGLAIGSIRHFFSGFDEVLAFTFAVVVSRIRERTGGRAVPDGADRLDAVAAALLPTTPGYVPHRENVAFLEYLMRARTVPHLRAENSRLQATGEEFVRDLVRTALAGTAATEEDVRLESTSLFATLNGIALADALGDEPFDEHDARRILTRTLDRLRAAYPPTDSA